jgi:hypothetical protein
MRWERYDSTGPVINLQAGTRLCTVLTGRLYRVTELTDDEVVILSLAHRTTVTVDRAELEHDILARKIEVVR